jgi:DNA invertase Pin-like site-specific DNA recombinase
MKSSVIYARVSSVGDRQNTKRQVRDLKEYAAANGLKVVKVFEEHISGAKKNIDRPVLCECLDFCFSNSIDCLLLSELSRLGRATWEVLENVKKCRDNHLNVIFQKEGLSIFNNDGTESFTLPVIISCLGMAAQMERENIAYRLNSGRNKYIADGGKLGRKEGYRISKEDYKKKYGSLIVKLTERKKHLDAGLRDSRDNLRAISADYKVSVATIQTIRRTFNL